MEPQPPSALSAPSAPSTSTTLITAFPAHYNLLALAPIFVVVSSFFNPFIGLLPHGISELPTFIYIPISLLAAMSICYLLYVQGNYFKQFYPNKSIKPQLVLLVFTFLLPIIAVNAGDILGAAHYNTAANGIVTSGLAGLALGSVAAICFADIFAVGNMIFIKTRGLNDGLRIFGTVIYCIGFLVVALISFVAYSLTYSAHDPSSE